MVRDHLKTDECLRRKYIRSLEVLQDRSDQLDSGGPDLLRIQSTREISKTHTLKEIETINKS